MLHPTIGYHRDDECHWVAELACGHHQHVRHQPPWVERPWVTTQAGRRSRLGMLLACVKCDRGDPEDTRPVRSADASLCNGHGHA